jgi:hypothetical protein
MLQIVNDIEIDTYMTTPKNLKKRTCEVSLRTLNKRMRQQWWLETRR